MRTSAFGQKPEPTTIHFNGNPSRQIMVHVVGDRLLIRVPGEGSERFPTNSEEIVFGLHDGEAIEIARFQELAVNLSRGIPGRC